MEAVDELKAVLAKYVLVEGKCGALDDWAFFISLKQRWFNMAESKALISKAIELGLLKEIDSTLETTFDVKGLELPAMYTPSRNLVSKLSELTAEQSKCECPNESILDVIISRITEKSNRKTEVVKKDVLRVQDETMFTVETAALLVAMKHDVDVPDLFKEVRLLLSP